MKEFDLVVIGGGSAGLKAARTAASKGRSVAMAEEREIGGECFWGGCVPTKAMVRAAQAWHLVGRAADFGIHVSVQSKSFSEAMRYKDRVLREVAGEGPADAGLSKLGAAYFHTHARFVSPHELQVGGETISGKQIVVACGTVPLIPDVPGLREAGFITNREAVALTSLPRRLCVIGAGPIGLEFAQIFCRFGALVTVVELGDQVLPREDLEIADLAATYLREEGVTIHTGCRIGRVERADGRKLVHISQPEGLAAIECDEILVAAGRLPAIEGMDIQNAGLTVRGRGIAADLYLKTPAKHIWAAGDVNGGYLFTHVASAEGRLAADNAFDPEPKPFDDRVVPRCTFIDPEVASIGLTASQAQQTNVVVSERSFSMANLDRAIIHNDARGLVKLVVDERNCQILGAHLIGPDASSIVAEIAVCMKNHLPLQAIADTMHAYPSFPEAVEAAALATPTFRGQVEGS